MIDAFEQLCLKPAAERTAALAAADRMGWAATPAAIYTGQEERNAAARLGSLEKGKQLLLVYEKRGAPSGVLMLRRYCTVMATVDSPATIKTYAQGLAGRIAGRETDPYGSVWVYRQGEDGTMPIITRADAKAAVDAGQYRELTFSDTQTPTPPGNTALELVVATPP